MSFFTGGFHTVHEGMLTFLELAHTVCGYCARVLWVDRSLNLHTCWMLRNGWCGVGGCYRSLNLQTWSMLRNGWCGVEGCKCSLMLSHGRCCAMDGVARGKINVARTCARGHGVVWGGGMSRFLQLARMLDATQWMRRGEVSTYRTKKIGRVVHCPNAPPLHTYRRAWLIIADVHCPPYAKESL